MAAPDPKINPPSSSSQRVKVVSQNRLKSISGGGPNFTSDKSLKSFPNADSPYRGSK